MSQNVVTVSLNEKDPLKQNHAIREIAQRIGATQRILTAATTFYVRSDGVNTNTFKKSAQKSEEYQGRELPSVLSKRAR